MSYTDDLFKVVGISTNPYPSVWDEDECSKTSYRRHSKKFEVKLTDYGEFISPKRNIMTKEEIQKKIDELGIISIEDANSLQTIEDAIHIVEEANKSPVMIAAPLVIDAETDRKLFNTREKVFAYFAEKGLDAATARKVMQEVMKANKTFYPATAIEEKDKLAWDVEMYLTYGWIDYRK